MLGLLEGRLTVSCRYWYGVIVQLHKFFKTRWQRDAFQSPTSAPLPGHLSRNSLQFSTKGGTSRTAGNLGPHYTWPCAYAVQE